MNSGKRREGWGPIGAVDFRRSSQWETGPVAAKMEAATSKSQGTICRKVVCGVLSRTTAPTVPPSRPAKPNVTARRRFLRMSFQYAAMEVSWPGHRATVLVALAWTGNIFMLSMAGKRRKEPPPATALSTPARKAATVSQNQCQSMNKGRPGRWIMVSFIVEGSSVWSRIATRLWPPIEVRRDLQKDQERISRYYNQSLNKARHF